MTRSRYIGDPRIVRRIGGRIAAGVWAVFCLILLVVSVVFFFVARNAEDARSNPNAQQVSATVDSSTRHCSSSSNNTPDQCGFDLFGSYTIAGQRETNVELRSNSQSQGDSEMQVLVDPANPRTVIDKGVSPTAAKLVSAITGGVFVLLFAPGILMLVIAARRRRSVQRP